jgi:beta-lactamase class A
MISRRAVLPLPLLALLPAASPTQRLSRAQMQARLARLADTATAVESASGGRCGFAILDLKTGARASFRADERFPMCSTFKLFLAAQVLDAHHRRQLDEQQQLPITAADMVDHAPFTQPRIGQSASIADLAEATMVNSDNPATNLLLSRLGGPDAHTAWLRRISDRTTRLDRYEPMMSEGLPGDPRDTSTPAAMLATSHRLLFGQHLPMTARTRLLGWMHASETGDTMIRVGLPSGWREANKTGSGSRGIRNIISLITPPGRAPLLLVLMLTEAERDIALRNRHHATFAADLAKTIAT